MCKSWQLQRLQSWVAQLWALLLQSTELRRVCTFLYFLFCSCCSLVVWFYFDFIAYFFFLTFKFWWFYAWIHHADIMSNASNFPTTLFQTLLASSHSLPCHMWMQVLRMQTWLLCVLMLAYLCHIQKTAFGEFLLFLSMQSGLYYKSYRSGFLAKSLKTLAG